ncbi:MAG: hypothetical protein ACO1OB_21955 [Archangium sp.]
MTTIRPKLPIHEPPKKGNDKGANPTTPGKHHDELPRAVDTFCGVVEVKGNNVSGRPVITRAANDCVVPLPPTVITA